jgi:hypothetical protein
MHGCSDEVYSKARRRGRFRYMYGPGMAMSMNTRPDGAVHTVGTRRGDYV